MDKKLIDTDKIMEWINFEIAKQFPDGVKEYADGRKSVLELLARRIEQGVFAPYPSPLSTIKPGKKGLYSKYTVIHNETGKPIEGECFVLRPDRDNAAFGALMVYAELTENTDLAMDITKWLSGLEGSKKCSACNGSGHYDAKGSPKCGACGGTGKKLENH